VLDSIYLFYSYKCFCLSQWWPLITGLIFVNIYYLSLCNSNFDTPYKKQASQMFPWISSFHASCKYIYIPGNSLNLFSVPIPNYCVFTFNYQNFVIAWSTSGALFQNTVPGRGGGGGGVNVRHNSSGTKCHPIMSTFTYWVHRRRIHIVNVTYGKYDQVKTNFLQMYILYEWVSDCCLTPNE
jgi:hypothetical protein